MWKWIQQLFGNPAVKPLEKEVADALKSEILPAIEAIVDKQLGHEPQVAKFIKSVLEEAIDASGLF